jgi:hypothetical protein
MQHYMQHHLISQEEQIMATPRKSTRNPRTTAETAEVAGSFIPFYTKNVERLAEITKKSLDVAVEQNAELLETCKKAFHLSPETPALFWFDLFGQSFERYVQTQKETIDVAVEQNNKWANLVKERSDETGKFVDDANTLLQEAVDHTVAAHKKNLEFCAEQQKAAYETTKKQFHGANPFADAFQSGVNLLMETQKTMLDIASRPLKHAAAA